VFSFKKHRPVPYKGSSPEIIQNLSLSLITVLLLFSNLLSKRYFDRKERKHKKMYLGSEPYSAV
jgi:hypothetical protein